MRANRQHVFGVLSLLLLAACGDDSAATGDDVAADSGAHDAGHDATSPGADATAGFDAGGGTDAAVSADTGSTADASADTDAGADATADTGVDTGIVLPSISFATSAGKTWEGTGAWQVTVQLSAAATTDVSVTLAADPSSTAATPADFTLPAAIVIPAGQTTASANVAIVNDSVIEGDETIVLGLSALSGAVAGATAQTYSLKVVDDELRAWPGSNTIAIVDDANVFGDNLSDLAYQPATTTPVAAGPVLWAVRNDDGGNAYSAPHTPALFQLTFNGTVWTPVTTNGWTTGKQLLWPAVAGETGMSPDSEGLTFAEYGTPYIYVATERDNNARDPNNNKFSRTSVLRFDTSVAGASLTALNEWKLLTDIPKPSDSNLGFEAVAWVPDSYLTANGFYDESAMALYAPATYPNHGTGLFFVGLEDNGVIYAYALNHTTNGFVRVATINSGLVAKAGGSSIMGLSFDRDVGQLWASCDNHCNNQTSVLKIDNNPAATAKGRFGVWARIASPTAAGFSGMNNEGISVTPESTCTAGNKGFIWTDDGYDANHALRSSTIPCGDFL